LPAGRWHDWWTGETLTGPRWVERPVDLATLPLYVRAGGIVPIDPVRQYTAQPVAEPTTIRIYPGADGTFTLYDDDGHSTAYLSDPDTSTARLRFQWDDAARRLTIQPDPRMKRSTGTRVFRAQVAGSDANPKLVEFNGERAEIRL
jgi:alpha-glucosidase/alpha-D-xyloside xylohydrolase